MENNHSELKDRQLWIIIILIAIGVMYAIKNFNVVNKDTKFITKQFEYQIKFVYDLESDSVLNEIGDEGWQVVGSRRASSSTYSSLYGYELILMKEK
jgi:hypothetical protein